MRNVKKPRQRKKYCDFVGKIATYDDLEKVPKLVRCKYCKKRLKPKIRTCTGDLKQYCCVFVSLSKHRTPV